MKIQENCLKDDQALKLLRTITTELKSLFAEISLNYLAKCQVINENILRIVLDQFSHTQDLTKLVFSMDSIIKNQDISEMIKLELLKGKNISTACIGKYFYVTNTQCFRKLFFDDKEDVEFHIFEDSKGILFWILIEVKPPNIVECLYYLPEFIIRLGLNSDRLSSRLTKSFESIEARVYQRILLKNLEETGKMSELLMPNDNKNNSLSADYKNDKSDFARRRFQRLANSKTKNLEVKIPEKANVNYKLDLQHQKEFVISDRMAKNECINSMTMKFSIPPFLIHNRDGLYMLIQDTDIFLFKLSENDPKSNDLSSPNTKGTPKIRTVGLELYGIDEPTPETIEKLEARVQEQLQQIFLFKLADSLIKNQKKIMTLNDALFIKGNQLPILVYFPVNICQNMDLLINHIKQNLMKFLLNYEIKDENDSIFVYNYLNIMESTCTKSSGSFLVSRQDREQTPFLGNTFGKALGIILINSCFFNGESITERTIDIQEDFKYQRTYLSEIPYKTCNHIEICIFKNGPLNEIAFLDYLEMYLNISVSEFLIESLILNLDTETNFRNTIKSLKSIIKDSLQNSTPKIDISVPPFECFNYFESLVSIIRKTLDLDFPFYFCICEDENILILTEAVEDLRKFVGKFMGKGDRDGRNMKFIALGGSFCANKKNLSELKMHTDDSEHVFIKKSLVLYLEMSKDYLELYSYNWNKNTLTKIHTNLETHVH